MIKKTLKELDQHKSDPRMTGDVAHKIRNSLAGAKIELSCMLNYHGKGRTSVEELRDSVVVMVEKFFQINAANHIPEDQFMGDILPDIKKITDLSDHLSDGLNAVSAGVDRGINITDKIRKYSTLIHMTPEKEQVSPYAILQQIAETHHPVISHKKIGFHLHIPKNIQLIMAKAHADTIFSNLFTNALNAVSDLDQKKGRITCSAEQVKTGNGRFVKLLIEDNGKGMDQTDVGKIYDPFYKVTNTSGLGLGLWVVKRLIEGYEGTITCHTKLEKGTVFEITLPGHTT